MAIQFLPALLIALRTAGPALGRAGLMAARQAMTNPGTRRAAGLWVQQRLAGQQAAGAAKAATPPATPPSPSANTQAARQFYFQAAKHFGVARPSGPQLMQFAKQQNQPAEQAAGSLGTLALKATALSTSLGALRLATREYGRGIEERAAALRMFSPQINTAAALAERSGILRQVASARRVGGSTAGLLAARERLADAQQPYRDLGSNIKNVAATFMTEAQTMLIRSIPHIVATLGPQGIFLKKALEKIMKSLEDQEKNQAAVQGDLKTFFRQTSLGDFPMSPSPHEMRANQRGAR